MQSYTIYTEEDGKYYKQNMVWWEKGGYFVPQARKRITREEYEIKTQEKEIQNGNRSTEASAAKI